MVEEEAEEEIVSEGATKAEDTSAQGKREGDIDRIRTKALLRRARARSEMGGWAALSGAEEGTIQSSKAPPVDTSTESSFPDYKLLSQMQSLSDADRKLVQTQIAVLPARTKAAQESEMADMMGKLKSLGNGILKPFGLSTENFQMVKDEKTGGYSMNFNQGQ